MKKRVLAIILAVACIGSMFIGAIAADSMKEITAYINYGLKMKVGNVEWNPTEDDGSAVRPITYNGRTYLPVRALGEKLGVAIDYDAATQTVLIGEKEWTPITAEMVDAHDDMGYTKNADVLYNGNGVYDFGLFVSKKWIGNQFTDINITAGKKFSTMKMSGYCTGADKVITVTDTDTKAVLKTITLKDGVATDFEFDITGVNKVNIKWGGNEANSLVFGNVYMK